MKIKTSELKGAALDWAVAKSEELIDKNNKLTYGADLLYDIKTLVCLYARFNPSANWSQGGPIIEREEIWIEYTNNKPYAKIRNGEFIYGSTMLIAAMRCYVASKFGDVIDVPDELLA